MAVQEPESWSRRLSITVPAERILRIRQAVTQQITRNARLPGFRQGKLPQRVLEQRFGPSIEQETIDRAIQEAYREAVDSNGLAPINQAKVENIQYDGDKALTFDAEFEVRPEIVLERTSSFTASRPSSDITEEDVDNVLDRLRDERGVWQPLEAGTALDSGDQVTVEITALEPDGSVKPGEQARPYRFVTGEGQALPAVEEAILSLKPGESGDFNVEFPGGLSGEGDVPEEHYLHIELSEASRKELAELNDEFARSVGDFEDLEALRARVLADLEEDAHQRADSDVRGQLVEQIIEANPFDVPTSMVDRYLDYMTGLAQDNEELQKERTPEEEEQLAKAREGLRPQAEASLKRMMVVENLADTEGLRATQDEIDARVEEIAIKHDRSPSEVWIQLEKSGQLDALEREITEDKVFEHLFAQNTIA
ncbi:MAG TPA: trigger factor [Longimicrobiaceae bacterium]|nr:trigger factor [Longimicrobiaceae bacterium]